jgi:8-oxo-dGTP pyrophosphatase MutT (NUDIX family)
MKQLIEQIVNKKVKYSAAGIIKRKGDGNVDEILMIQRAKKDFYPNQWEFPRGGCEEGKDKSLRDCMMREVKEETGLDVKPVKFIDKTRYIRHEGMDGKIVTICYNYVCKMLNPDQEVHLSKEHQSFKWISEVGEVELMASPEQKKTIQKVLNHERTIVSIPKPQKMEESNLDFYLNALDENEHLSEDPVTIGAALMTAGSVALKLYIGAMLIKLAKDVFKVNFTKIGRQCKDYPGGERGICMLRAKKQAKEAELTKLKSVVSRCSKDKSPEDCKRKVAGRLSSIGSEISYMNKRLGELRKAPIVH